MLTREQFETIFMLYQIQSPDIAWDRYQELTTPIVRLKEELSLLRLLIRANLKGAEGMVKSVENYGKVKEFGEKDLVEIGLVEKKNTGADKC